MENKLREVRVIRRISQFKLRLLSGVNQTRISLIENEMVEAREEEKKGFARVLGVKPEEIFPTEERNGETLNA